MAVPGSNLCHIPGSVRNRGNRQSGFLICCLPRGRCSCQAALLQGGVCLSLGSFAYSGWNSALTKRCPLRYAAYVIIFYLRSG